jgi:hypothetical protein
MSAATVLFSSFSSELSLSISFSYSSFLFSQLFSIRRSMKLICLLNILTQALKDMLLSMTARKGLTLPTLNLSAYLDFLIIFSLISTSFSNVLNSNSASTLFLVFSHPYFLFIVLKSSSLKYTNPSMSLYKIV